MDGVGGPVKVHIFGPKRDPSPQRHASLRYFQETTGIQNRKIRLTGGDTVIGVLNGSGDPASECVVPLERAHLDKMAAVGNIRDGLRVTD
jgi:hypothetical protein